MPRGRIVDLKNNYGIIATDAFKFENEYIPFNIENYMLNEKDGKQYIKYTEEVEFDLSQTQGVRGRDIKEATGVRFIGDEWKYKERIIENNIIQNIRKRLSEYNFYYPILDDKEFADWLECNNFHPRMLEYLSPGMFIPKKIIKMQAGKIIDLECMDAKFKIGLLFVIDRIDIEFRKNILSWITSIENWIYVNTLDNNLGFLFFTYYLDIQNISYPRFLPVSKSYNKPKQLYTFAQTPLESYS